MWELDDKEGKAPKNWCFWTVVLEKTLESPLDSKNSQSYNESVLNTLWKDWYWRWSSNTWPPDANSWLIVKDPDAGSDWRQRMR